MIHDDNKLILVGKILSPHSLNGMVKIISYTQNNQDLFKQTALMLQDGTIISINSHKLHQNDVFICKVKGINTRTDAEKIAKNSIFIEKSQLQDLEEDEFYVEDLKGMTVVAADGKNIGVIADIYNFGAGDIIEIQFNNGCLEMFQFHHTIFPKIDSVVTFIPPKIL